jgi:hypothetical protein
MGNEHQQSEGIDGSVFRLPPEAPLLQSDEMQQRMAHMAAERQLHGMFQITDPAHPSAHTAGNQVTQEQYQHIVDLYSDISLNRTDLHFDEPGRGTSDYDTRDFRHGTMQDMGRIMQTAEGREMLERLAHNTDAHGAHHVTHLADGTNHPWNAGAGNAGENSMNGHGQDAHVSYAPGATVLSQLGHDEGWSNIRSDVTLFHELSHAMHETDGTIARGNVTNASLDAHGVAANDMSRDDVRRRHPILNAEHQAVGIGAYAHDRYTENAYRRARMEIAHAGGPGIVADSQGNIDGDASMTERRTYGEYAPH